MPLANGGYRPPVHVIRRVTTTAGKVLYEYRHDAVPRVLRDDVVAMMNHMMSATLEAGTGTAADFGWPAAGKTGTSQKSRDAWFVGYTSNLTTGVWFGNDDGTPMKNVTGGSLPAKAWHDFMAAAHKGVPVAGLPGGRWNPVPTGSIGGGDSAPLVAEQAPGVPRPVSRVGGGDGARRTGGPVPPADVGAAPRSGERRRTLFDVLLGN